MTHSLRGEDGQRRGQHCMRGSQRWNYALAERRKWTKTRSALHARLTTWNYALPERQKWMKTRSALHARLRTWNYTLAKRRDEVSIACEAHNMELRTR